MNDLDVTLSQVQLGHWFKLKAGKISKETSEAAAFDLFYNGVGDIYIGDMPVAVPTGVFTEFSNDIMCVIKEKSGLALKGIEVKAGLIDSDYRDEWKVVLRFPIQEDLTLDYIPAEEEKLFKLTPGMKIAQFIVVEKPKVSFIDVTLHDGDGIFIKNEVRKGGFGSTGV